VYGSFPDMCRAFLLAYRALFIMQKTPGTMFVGLFLMMYAGFFCLNAGLFSIMHRAVCIVYTALFVTECRGSLVVTPAPRRAP